MRQAAKASRSTGSEESFEAARQARAAASGVRRASEAIAAVTGRRHAGSRSTPIRPGHDPGGTAMVTDPALGDAAFRLVEHACDMAGQPPVTAPKGYLDSVPEELRSPPAPLRPQGERAVAGLVLGAGDLPELGRGLEAGQIGAGLEEGPGPMALVPDLDRVRRDLGVHVEKVGPAMLPGKAIEPQTAYDIRHRRVPDGGEERLDLGVGVPAEIAPEFEVSQPWMERMPLERFGKPFEAPELAPPQGGPGLQEDDPLDGLG